ncbi:MAG: DUF2934 domain-containing protein, partial [Verrucomicrobiota bacterium]
VLTGKICAAIANGRGAVLNKGGQSIREWIRSKTGKDNVMNAKSRHTKKPIPSLNLNPVAMVGTSPASPAKLQKAPPSQAQIAQVAYEIWIATGKQPDRDQQNWFEAEWQLRQI